MKVEYKYEKMRILFVFPSITNVLEPAKHIPLNLCYLAAVCEQVGHEAAILDFNIHRDNKDERFKEKVRWADIVGFTSVTPAIEECWRLCRVAKETKSTIRTVLGGPHISVLPEESLKLAEVDFVVQGEGEETIKELCNALSNGNRFEQIKGLSFKTEGKLKSNPPRPLMKNLDNLPFPAYHLLEMERYKRSAHPLFSDPVKRPAMIMTSRGCPFACNFCYNGIYGNTFRFRSPKNVVDEIQLLVEKYNVDYLSVEDDLFVYNPKRAIEICRLIIERGLKFRWECAHGIRVDTVNEEVLRWMKKAGCFRLFFGLESGDQEVLNKLMNKKITLEKARNGIAIAKGLGFELGGYFLLGYPGETIDSMNKTINWALELEIDYALFNIPTPYPGSKLYNQVKHLLGDELSWDTFRTLDTSYVYIREFGLKPEQLIKMRQIAYRKFYFRPKYVIGFLTKKRFYKNLSLIWKTAIPMLFGGEAV